MEAAAAHVHVVQQGAMAVAALLMLWLVSKALWHLVWQPYAVAQRFERQGILGPPYRLAVGSLLECKRMVVAGRARGALDAGCHDYASIVYPFFHKWISDYGKTFLLWFGPAPAICSTDMEFVNQVLADRTDLFPKGYLNTRFEDVVGKGLVLVDGDVWKRHRKIVHPIFNPDKLKYLSILATSSDRSLVVSSSGKTFLLWFGSAPAICSTDMEFVNQVLADRTDLFPKGYLNTRFEDVGKGLVLVDGDVWKCHRKIVHPIFNPDKLKSISEIMSEGTRQLMERWCGEIEESSNQQTETDMKHDSHKLTLEVITRVVFGNDHKEFDSEEMLDAMKELQGLVMTAFLELPVPGFRYLPTRRNRRSRQLDDYITSKIMKLVKARVAAGGVRGHDLLGRTKDAWCDGERLSIREVIDECKTILFAGQDTTANLLTWVMFLLSFYPEWQEKVREELLRECPGEVPAVDVLAKLKLLNMCLPEALRLYNPVPFVMRRAAMDTVVANIEVPKGTEIIIPIAMMYRDEEVWGADADEFNPARFESDAGGKLPSALLAFSAGPRVCAGQNFAMIELRTAMAMLLGRFSFSVSPAYVHKPIFFVTLMPRYRVPLIVRKLQPSLFMSTMNMCT